MAVLNCKFILITIIVLPFILTVQGCMLMHHIGDHHSSMMGHGHGNQDHENREKMGHEAIQGADLLDRQPRKDIQGGTTVEIRFNRFTKDGKLAFSVSMRDHIIGMIGQNRLDDFATLANDQGTQIQASQWQSVPSTSQDVSGTLYFPPNDGSGRPLINHDVKVVTLTIKELEGVPERVFQWNIPSGH